MKDKVLKIILIITPFPLIGILIWAICNFIFGTSFMLSEIYGLDAFLLTIIASIFIYGPVLLICLLYQLFYLARHLIKKHKSRNVGVDAHIDPQDKN